MATLSELQAQLEQLQQAHASGVLQIRKGDDSTMFKSGAEMLAAMQTLQARIKALDSVGRTYRMVRFTTRDGY